MSTPDLINGLFEFGSGMLLWQNVRQLRKDKQVRGISLVPSTLFTLWGYWNLFYYPHLHQWLSFLGGLMIVVSNSVWLGMAFYYSRRSPLHDWLRYELWGMRVRWIMRRRWGWSPTVAQFRDTEWRFYYDEGCSPLETVEEEESCR